MKKIASSLLLFSIAYLTIGQTPVNQKFGDGIFNVIAVDSSWSMKFGARFQTLFVGDFQVSEKEGIQEANSNFQVRRARLKFNGFAYSPKLEYKIELGLSSGDLSGASIESSHSSRMVYDAVLKWNFHSNFYLWAGQTKLPGNRERVVSSGNLQFVDRSLLNKNYNIDRDIGIQLRHHFTLGEQFLVREILAISQGDGRNVNVGNLGGYEYTGRIEFLPFGNFSSKGDYVGSDIKREQKPKLAIGISYDINNRAVRERGNMGSFMRNDVGYHEADIETLFADLMFKYKGFSIMAEYADKQTDIHFASHSDGSLTGDHVNAGTGLNLQAGYLFMSNWELAARYTSIEPAKEINQSIVNQYTLGTSKYIVGHKLKVQADISYTTQDRIDDHYQYRLQFDIHF
ncbi:MAG: porin [Bacteroidetes bacterium]|nr:MAG: porin [Bacteroidota bacterium]MBL1143316.1 porin [Bacteroidota bacterium]NOG56118.1 porin [Bacteroidota bacterium]